MLVCILACSVLPAPKDRVDSGPFGQSAARLPDTILQVVRAVVMHEFGPPAVLVPEQVADPEPGEGQVLIDVERASITFVETQVRAGRPPSPAMLPGLPAILGNGVGGAVA